MPPKSIPKGAIRRPVAGAIAVFIKIIKYMKIFFDIFHIVIYF
jgi:hypothetical protein